jgi:nucleolar MIF4G domain-containing protein 1
MITAFQRLFGQSFFAPMIDELFKVFIETHKSIHSAESSVQNLQVMLKNIIAIFTHFYLFESITHTLISDVIKHLLKSFKEKDIEMLLNLLHNIGGILRKDSPGLCKDIILMCESKRIEAKISFASKAPPSQNPQQKAEVPSLTAFERKVKFLTEELTDIRNNKVKQSKLLNSLKLYLNWLKTNSQVKSELLKNPLEVDFETIEKAHSSGNPKWWMTEEEMQQYETNVKINEIESKFDKSYLSQLEKAAKMQRFATDIQKSVFYTIMGSDDYLDAYQSLQKLGLKKKQEREIVKVIVQCSVQEKVYNKYYSLILKKFCEQDKSFQYSLKYTLWDYIKIVDEMELRKIVNLAKIYGFLFKTKGVPLSVLKIIDFYDRVNKNLRLFLNVAFDQIFYPSEEEENLVAGAETTQDVIRAVFEKLKSNQTIEEFKDGLSSYLSANYYKYRTKQKGAQTDVDKLEKKLKVAMDTIAEPDI